MFAKRRLAAVISRMISESCGSRTAAAGPMARRLAASIGDFDVNCAEGLIAKEKRNNVSVDSSLNLEKALRRHWMKKFADDDLFESVSISSCQEAGGKAEDEAASVARILRWPRKLSEAEREAQLKTSAMPSLIIIVSPSRPWTTTNTLMNAGYFGVIQQKSGRNWVTLGNSPCWLSPAWQSLPKRPRSLGPIAQAG